MIKDDTSKKRKLPTIDHGVDIIGDEWEDEWVNWEDEADVRPIYNDAQMLNGTFEGDSISKIKNKRRPDQMKFELHGPGPDEEK